MIYQKKYWAILAIMACFVVTTQALAEAPPTPEEIADKCIDSVTDLADRFVDHAQTVSDDCVGKIENLILTGRFEAAEAVAQKEIKNLRQRADICSGKIHRRCKECAVKLLSLEKPALATKVKQACKEQVDKVRVACRQAVKAIKAVLPVAE